MLGSELYERFRSDVVDLELPYLWSEDEVWAYMTDAYRMFARLTGGIPDATSRLTQIPIAAGQATSAISPLVLKFRTAFLKSDGSKLGIINDVDEPLTAPDDYGQRRIIVRDTTPGVVTHMMIGTDRNARRGVVRWIRVPMIDDTVMLSVWRLPIDIATADFDFYEVGEEHHEHFLLWMKARAYGKQDAETFDRGRREENDKAFRAYCDQAKAESVRYRNVLQPVLYGGI